MGFLSKVLGRGKILRSGAARQDGLALPVGGGRGPVVPQKVTVASTPRSRRQFRMYQAAQVSRLTQDWPITLTSANAEILVSAVALRSRLRQLERDDDYFRQMLWTLENNVIGDRGIEPVPKLKNADGSYNKEEILMLRRAWHAYLEQDQCTVAGNLSGIELQRLIVRALARDGGILLRIHRGYPNDFSFALEPLEIDRLDFFWNRPYAPAARRDGLALPSARRDGLALPSEDNANEIQFGVEMDRLHRPQAYWILTRHPGEVFAWRAGPKYRERVPAQDIIAIWTVERAGQCIGMPLWPSVGNRLAQLHGYENAELVAARLASCKGGWFEKNNENSQYEGPEDIDGNKLVDTQPGQWEELPLGWKAVSNDPTHPTTQYPDFVKSQLRGASSGANQPYNTIANDLEGVNYSSIRAGLLDSRDGYKYLQRLATIKAMRPWFTEWLPWAILTGRVKFPLTRLKEICEATKFRGRRWPWVDPLKDVQADAMAVELGFTSRRRVIEESAEGGDIEEVFEEQEEDKKLAEAHGLTFNATLKPPQAPQPPGGAGAGEGGEKD